MRLLPIAAAASCLVSAPDVRAHPPRDDFLNPQPAGRKLTLVPFVGPGFRAVYDERVEVEKDMSEVRAQLTGTVALPFAEVSASVDARFFLMTFGASVGYHDEWRVLRFTPSAETGRDRGGQAHAPEPPGQQFEGRDPLPPDQDPTPAYTELNRSLRAVKDQSADVETGHWPFYEGRLGFLWPAYGFMGVSTLAARHDGRPDVSYDWENATVYSGGWHLRWESYFLLRERSTGFIGPAVRVLYVPRHRVEEESTTGPLQVVVPEGSACQPGEGVPCDRRYEAELHYGVLAGIRPGWADGGSDTFLVRVFTTWGLQNELFGTHTFRQPVQILAAYMLDLPL